MTDRVLISLPDGFLDKVDLAAALEQRTRSEFLREAVRHYINANFPQLNTLDKRRAKRKQKEENAKAKPAKKATPKTEKPVVKAKTQTAKAAPAKKAKKSSKKLVAAR